MQTNTWGACALATLGLLVGGKAGAESVIVADRELAAIYERTTDEGPGLGRLLSGKVPFIADQAVFATADVAFFRLGERIAEFHFSTGSLEQIDTIPVGLAAAAIAADAGPNNVAILLHDPITGNVSIREGSRSGPGQPWTFADTGAVLPNVTGSTSTLRIVQPSADTWAVTIDSNLLLVSRANPASPTAVPTVPPGLVGGAAIGSRGNGEWILHWPTRDDLTTVVYSAGGGIVRMLPPGEAGLFNESVRALDWKTATPPVYASTTDGIYSAGDPAAGATDFSLASSFLTGNAFDPSRDVGDATDLERTSGGDWRVFRSAAGTVSTVSGSAGTLSTATVLQRGSGPPFGLIVDFSVDGDKLFVLCGAYPPQAVVEVDRPTGNRSIVAILPGDRYYSGITPQPDGSLLLAHRLVQTASPELDSLDRIDRLTITGDPNAPVLDLVASSPQSRAPTAVIAAPSGAARIVRLPLGSLPIQTIDGGNLVDAPPVGVDTVPVFTDDAGTLVAPIDIPDSVPLQQADSLVWNFDFDSTSGTAMLEVRAPDDTTVHTGSLRTFSSLRNRWEFRVDITAVAQRSGEWEMRLLNVVPSNATVTVHPRHAPRILHAVADAEDSLRIIERHPPRVGRYMLATGEVTRADIALASGESFDIDELNRVSSLALDAETGDLFATNFESPMVFRIDPGTAEASLFVTGRPSEIDEDLLGASGEYAGFIVRTGPVVLQEATVQFWAVY